MRIHDAHFHTATDQGGIVSHTITVGATTGDRFDRAEREGWILANEKTVAWAEVCVHERQWAPVETLGLHVRRGEPGRQAAVACLDGLLEAAWEIIESGWDHSTARGKIVGRAV